MTDMLKAGLDEGGTSSNLWGYEIFKGKSWKDRNEMGGKTGTSSNHSDGWFVGVSKGMVAGAWVGGDDRCIHFRTTELGEGAKTALPIVGKFMEKIYSREELGVEQGPFPKPEVKITKRYSCHTAQKIKDKDSTSTVVEEDK
jgi:penicillin-binding protein 1A